MELPQLLSAVMGFEVSSTTRRVVVLCNHLRPRYSDCAIGLRSAVASVSGLSHGTDASAAVEEVISACNDKEHKEETQQRIRPTDTRLGVQESHEMVLSTDAGPNDGYIHREMMGAGHGDQEIYPAATEKVILIVGAGDATGGAVAKRFAKEGFVACIVRRHIEKLKPLADQIIADGGQVHSFGVDARKEEEMVKLVERIERDIGQIQVAVFNIGANVQFPILETTARVYVKVWEMACFAGFLTGRESAKHMVKRNKGTIIFTGATASVRGGSGYSAFAGGKFALRALAQSMARELGPKGVHVAHVIIDAAINTPWTQENIKSFNTRMASDGVVQPEDIAELYWQVHKQPRQAWTHEVDLRPHNEPW